MPTFDLIHLLVWLHFLASAVAIGGAVAALLISGLESEQSEYEGLSAALATTLAVSSMNEPSASTAK